MKIICLLCVLFMNVSSRLDAQAKLGVIYSQKAQRDDKLWYFHFMRDRHGRVTLTEDSLIFTSRKVSTSFFNFAFAYCDIQSIRTWYVDMFIPNRIRIKTKNAGAVRLFTDKRRTLIRLTREKMAACAAP